MVRFQDVRFSVILRSQFRAEHLQVFIAIHFSNIGSIFGNIPEAEDLNWSCRTECESCDSAEMSAMLQSGSNREVVEDTQAVVTRAQAKSEGKVKLLNPGKPKFPISNLMHMFCSFIFQRK